MPAELKVLLLGLLQGFTEFLPVSSSGHLVLGKHLLGITSPGAALEIVLHLASAAVIVVVLRREIGQLIVGVVTGLGTMARTRRLAAAWADPSFRLAMLILLASIPAGVIGVKFDKIIEAQFDNVRLVGATLLMTGAALWSTRYIRRTAVEPVSAGRALLIGLAQAVAILPGISRSGSTISAGLWAGLEREAAVRFSFLLFLPAGLGAAVLKVKELGHASGPAALAVGFVSAAAASYLALRLLLRFVRRGVLHWFAPYCWALGILALAA